MRTKDRAEVDTRRARGASRSSVLAWRWRFGLALVWLGGLGCSGARSAPHADPPGPGLPASAIDDIPSSAADHPEIARIRALRSRVWLVLTADDPRRVPVLLELADALVTLARALRADATRLDPYAARVALPADVSAGDLGQRAGTNVTLADVAGLPEPPAPPRASNQLQLVQPHARDLIVRSDRLVTEALRCYAEVLERFPNDHAVETALAQRARLSELLGQHTSMLREYALLLDRFPSSVYAPAANAAFGDFYYERGQYAEAAEFYRSVARSSEADLVPHAELRLAMSNVYVGGGAPTFDLLVRAARDARARGQRVVLAETYDAAPSMLLERVAPETTADVIREVLALTGGETTASGAIVLSMTDQLHRSLRDAEALGLLHQLESTDAQNACAYESRAVELASDSGDSTIRDQERSRWSAHCSGRTSP